MYVISAYSSYSLDSFRHLLHYLIKSYFKYLSRVNIKKFVKKLLNNSFKIYISLRCVCCKCNTRFLHKKRASGFYPKALFIKHLLFSQEIRDLNIRERLHCRCFWSCGIVEGSAEELSSTY